MNRGGRLGGRHERHVSKSKRRGSFDRQQLVIFGSLNLDLNSTRRGNCWRLSMKRKRVCSGRDLGKRSWGKEQED